MPYDTGWEDVCNEIALISSSLIDTSESVIVVGLQSEEFNCNCCLFVDGISEWTDKSSVPVNNNIGWVLSTFAGKSFEP